MANIVNKLTHPEIVTAVAALLDDHKGEDTKILYIGGQSSYTDYFIITTAHSSVHLKSLTERIAAFLRKSDHAILYHSKAKDDSGWLLLDCGNFIVHVMDKEKRIFYELEKLCYPGPEIPYSSKSS
ncbi:MAG: ribosome silencing factor [Spirochaetales bacterium]|nr:ribosome silencing factor [Spirochaetales bacterium]